DFCGWRRRKGAIWFGSPGVSKSELLISSRSSLEVKRIGKPDCSVPMLLKAHPFTRWRVQLEIRHSGTPPVLTHHQPMAGVKQGRGTRLSRVDRIRGVFGTGSVVEGSAPGVGGQKLQAVRETLVHQSLERVVGRIGHRHLCEDAAEHGNPVRRTAGARGGFAEWR